MGFVSWDRDKSDVQTDHDSADSFFDLLRDHTGLAVSTVAISIGVLQILSLAAFNSVSALAIVQYYGVVQLATLLVVQLAPVVGLIGGVVIAAWVLVEWRNGRPVAPWIAVLGALAGLLVLSSISIIDLGLSVAALAVLAAAGWLASKRTSTTKLMLYGAVMVLITFFALLRSQPVLPTEELSTPGHTVLVGYVLQQTDDSIVVLRERDRQVVRAPSKSNRQLCRLVPEVRGPLQKLNYRPYSSDPSKWWNHPLVAVIDGVVTPEAAAIYPACSSK